MKDELDEETMIEFVVDDNFANKKNKKHKKVCHKTKA